MAHELTYGGFPVKVCENECDPAPGAWFAITTEPSTECSVCGGELHPVMASADDA